MPKTEGKKHSRSKEDEQNLEHYSVLKTMYTKCWKNDCQAKMGVGWLGLSHAPMELTSHIQLLEAGKQSATTKHSNKKEDVEMTWTHIYIRLV